MNDFINYTNCVIVDEKSNNIFRKSLTTTMMKI